MKKILLILMTVILSFSCGAMAACQGETEIGPIVNPNIINDFENYAEDFSPMLAANFFGKVTRNTDRKFVKLGKSSAKLEPSGDAFETNKLPTLRIPFAYQLRDQSFVDFTMVSGISLQVYNSASTPVVMKVHCDYTGGTTPQQEFTLAAGQWNRVLFLVDRAMIDALGSITNVTVMNFEFPIVNKGDQVPVLYFDVLEAVLADAEFKPIEMEFGENEIMFFEEPWQADMVSVSSGNGSYDPAVSINSSPLYAKEGNSLRIDYKGNTGDVTTWAYANFSLPQNVLARSGFRECANTDYFCFDIYNPEINDQRLFLELYNALEKMFFKEPSFTLKAGKWTEIRISFAELNQGYLDSRPGGAGGGPGKVAAKGGTDQASMVRFIWDYSITPKGERTMYLDNVRFEKGE